MIPDGEAVVGTYLRDHPDIVALDARVAGRTPGAQQSPWIRLTQLDAANEQVSTPEHLIAYLFQLDCYAGADAMGAHTGQAEAWAVAYAARQALASMPDGPVDGAVVTHARFTSMARIPDEGFEPARERVVLDTVVRMHSEL